MNFSDLATTELAVRMLMTGAIVVFVAIVVERSGPVIGGVVAGLPMVIGPGFFFLLQQATADFVSEAAAYALYSLCATQVFLFVYILVAGRLAPLIAVCVAIAAWAGAAIAVRLLPPEPVSGLSLFVFVTFCARAASAGALEPKATASSPQSVAITLLRAALAGALVATTTVAAGRLGARWSGLAMAFPVGYIVLSLTVHAQLGAAGVARMLHSALLGTVSLAMFCFSLAIAMPQLPAATAFTTAICVSFAVVIMLLGSQWTRTSTSL